MTAASHNSPPLLRYRGTAACLRDDSGVVRAGVSVFARLPFTLDSSTPRQTARARRQMHVTAYPPRVNSGGAVVADICAKNWASLFSCHVQGSGLDAAGHTSSLACRTNCAPLMRARYTHGACTACTGEVDDAGGRAAMKMRADAAKWGWHGDNCSMTRCTTGTMISRSSQACAAWCVLLIERGTESWPRRHAHWSECDLQHTAAQLLTRWCV